MDPAAAIAAVLDAWATNVNLAYIPHWVPSLAEVDRRLRLGGEAIGKAMRGPLEVLAIDATEGVDSIHRVLPWLDDHITSMVPVLLALAPERERQSTEEDDNG